MYLHRSKPICSDTNAVYLAADFDDISIRFYPFFHNQNVSKRRISLDSCLFPFNRSLLDRLVGFVLVTYVEFCDCLRVMTEKIIANFCFRLT